MVCLSYLFERRPWLDLKDPTIAVVIAHKRKIKKATQLRRVLSVDQNGTLVSRLTMVHAHVREASDAPNVIETHEHKGEFREP